MKIQMIDSNHYKIYYYKYFKDSYDEIKRIVEIIKKRTGLFGYLKAIIYKKSIGLFIELIRIDGIINTDNYGFKIVYGDKDVYYKTSDFFLVSNFSDVYYYDNYYYVKVNDYFFNVLDYIEFGEFVFGNNCFDIKRSIKI